MDVHNQVRQAYLLAKDVYLKSGPSNQIIKYDVLVQQSPCHGLADGDQYT